MNFLNLRSFMESENNFQIMSELFTRKGTRSVYSEMIVELESFNAQVDSLNVDMFKAIAESEDKSSENDGFIHYFNKFSQLVVDFNRKINSIASKAVINIENMVDVYSDSINNPDLTGAAFVPFSMKVETYKNIEDTKLPEFTAKKHYVKDFDSIGMQMQQLGNIATSAAKLGVIATVYNDLSDEMNGEFLKKCTEKLVGDSYDQTKSYAEQVYRLFRVGETEREISKTDLLSAKSALLNYTLYTGVITATAEKLMGDFDSISNSIHGMLYQNKASVLKINTETDGVANREYRLDSYAMNQLNLFMKRKADQLSQIINMYAVAFSIKADAVVGFMSQCKDIVVKAEESIDPTKSSDEDQNDNVDMNTDGGEDTDNGDDSEDITIGDEGSDDFDDDSDDFGDDDDSDDEDDDEDDDESEDEESSTSEFPAMEEVSDDATLDEMVLFFEYESFQLSHIMEQSILEERFFSILEDGETGGSDGGGEGTSAPANTTKDSISNVKKLANNNSNKAVDAWRWLVDKFLKIWRKFKDIFINKTSARIKQLKAHKNDIKNSTFSQNATLLRYKTPELLKIKIPDLNYNAMKADLSDADAFAQKHIFGPSGITMKDGSGVAGTIKNTIIPDQEEKGIDDNLKNQMYNFCVNEMESLVKTCETQKDIIAKAMNNAGRIAGAVYNASDKSDENTNEAVTFEAYFNEFTKGEGATNVKTEIMVYFRACTAALSTKISIANKAFNEFYRALSSLFNVKADTEDKTKKEEKPAEGEQQSEEKK